MQNDVLKNKIAPWQEKGRWYHATYDYSTESFIADETDNFINDNFNIVTLGSQKFLAPKITFKAIIKDCKVSIKSKLTIISAQYLALSTAYAYLTTRDYPCVSFAYTNAFVTAGIIDVWIFIE